MINARLQGRTLKCLTAALACLCALTLTMADDYDPAYDFPDRGDAWYGRDGLPDPRRDFPPTIVEAFSDGDDFGVGYIPELANNGQPVPLVRTNESLFGYVYFHKPSDRCFESSECTDGTVCNGAETCDGFSCQSGTPLNCNDGDPCTSDSCLPSSGCLNQPVPAPESISLLELSKLPEDDLVAELSWSAASGADSYNVYRGEEIALGDLACFEEGVLGLSTLDDGALPSGQLFVHLVSAADVCQESSLGKDSEGGERPNDQPCP